MGDLCKDLTLIEHLTRHIHDRLLSHLELDFIPSVIIDDAKVFTETHFTYFVAILLHVFGGMT